MNNHRVLALVGVGLVTASALTACNSTSTDSNADIASLDARVSALESQVAGLESIIGKTIIADPAAQLADLESRKRDLPPDGWTHHCRP